MLGVRSGKSLHTQILTIALPAIAANLTSVLPGLVDSAFIGRTGTTSDLGGVAIGTTLTGFILWAFGFLRLGTAGFTAQAYGADDHGELRATFLRGLVMAAAVSAILLLLSKPLEYFGLAFFNGSESVMNAAATYYRIRILAAPFDFVLYVTLGWLLGRQRVALVLLLEVILNILNIGFCALFVLHLGWGVEGAALATAIAVPATALAGLAIIKSQFRLLAADAPHRPIFDRARLLHMFGVNRDLFFRTIILMGFLSYLVSLSGQFGDAVLAGNHVLFGILATVAQALDGFTQATESLAGQAIGAADRGRLSKVVRATNYWCGVSALLICLGLLISRPFLVPLFIAEGPALVAADAHFLWLALSPLLSIWCFQLDGIYFGATRGRELRNGMIISGALALAATWALPSFLGSHALWASLYVLYFSRSITQLMWYPRIIRAVPVLAQTVPPAAFGVEQRDAIL